MCVFVHLALPMGRPDWRSGFDISFGRAEAHTYSAARLLIAIREFLVYLLAGQQRASGPVDESESSEEESETSTTNDRFGEFLAVGSVLV